MLGTTQNANYSIGGTLIATLEVTYSIGGVLETTLEVNYSIGGMLETTPEVNYSIRGILYWWGILGNTEDANYCTGIHFDR